MDWFGSVNSSFEQARSTLSRHLDITSRNNITSIDRDKALELEVFVESVLRQFNSLRIAENGKANAEQLGIVIKYQNSLGDIGSNLNKCSNAIDIAERKMTWVLERRNVLLALAGKWRVHVKSLQCIIIIQEKTLNMLETSIRININRPMHSKKRVFEEEVNNAIWQLYEQDSYPTSQVMDIFAKKHGLELKQVQNWFRLRRHRDKKIKGRSEQEPIEQGNSGALAITPHPPPPQISPDLQTTLMSLASPVVLPDEMVGFDFGSFDKYFEDPTQEIWTLLG